MKKLQVLNATGYTLPSEEEPLLINTVVEKKQPISNQQLLALQRAADEEDFLLPTELNFRVNTEGETPGNDTGEDEEEPLLPPTY